MRADHVLQERLFKTPQIEIVWNSVIDEILGDDHITGAMVKNVVTDEKKKLDFDGLFLAIGHKPNTDIFKKYITLDEDGYIITNPLTLETNIKGVFAAGDVQNKTYQQAVVAAGTGATAAMSAQKFLSELS